MTRRDFAKKSACVAGVGATVLKATAQEIAAQSTVNATKITSVDQNPIRRRGTGLRAIDPDRASPGLTLFAPMLGDGTVYLIDLQGNVVHTWKMPYPPGLYGYLTEKGTLIYNGKIPNETFLGKSPFKGGAVLEADWNGKVLWEIREPNHHHDGRLLRNGNVLLLCATEVPDDVAKKVQGGRSKTEVDGKMWADYLIEVTKGGRRVWEWRSWEHLDPATDVLTAIQENRSEWTHGNAIVELTDGNLLVSFRNISTIVKIERRTGKIMWTLGAPPLSAQHAPTPLPGRTHRLRRQKQRLGGRPNTPG